MVYDAHCRRSRFLGVDPLEGGSDYDYVDGDPVNSLDLAGTCNARKGNWRQPRACYARNVAGGVAGNAGRAARWAYRHTEVGVSVCAVRCLGLGTQGGTIYRQTGWGCGFLGANGGIASRKYQDRACNAFTGTAAVGPTAGYAEMGIYGNPKERGGLAPSADFADGWSPGWGAGLVGMTNRDILGKRPC